MKKLLYAIPVLCAIVLTGCPSEKKNPDDPTSGITAITVKPEKVTIAEGADIALTVIPTPKAAKGEYTWASSDTLVATVDADGKVTGITPGTAIITVTEKGGAKATSEIHVASYLESFTFGQAMVYDWNPEDTVGLPLETLRDGQYKAYKMPMNLLVYSDGFYVDGGGKYAGVEEALVITMPSYMYWAPAELNGGKGTIFVLGEWGIVRGQKENDTHIGEPGEYGDGVLTNVLAAMDAYNNEQYTDFGAYIQAAGKDVTGTSMTAWAYGCDEDDPTNCGYSTSYIPDAVLDSAYFFLWSDGSSDYMVLADSCSFTFRPLKHNWEEFIWGVKCSLDEENSKFVIEDRSKLYVGDPISMSFGSIPAEAYGAPRHEDGLIEVPESVIMTAEMRANLDRQIKEGKVRSINALVRNK